MLQTSLQDHNGKKYTPKCMPRSLQIFRGH